MRNIRCCAYASLAMIACFAMGCNAAAPPAAAPAPAAPGGAAAPVAPAAAANGQTPANPLAASGPAGAPAKVDAQIQQKLLALGARLKQDGGAGDLTRNDLKQIGLGFHNFHDTYNGFPALNGKGEPGVPNPGLSWRVFLLPYLDENALYDQFHFDEPWDSEHNKTLIPRLPKIFGTNAEGKTNIQVFTGPGAPFQMDKGFKRSDITDGESNTILAIEAGDDTADIWTKPTALIFEPADPLKCLGAIREFQALLFDGSVRTIKNVDKETFSKLIQHADGMPVEFPE